MEQQTEDLLFNEIKNNGNEQAFLTIFEEYKKICYTVGRKYHMNLENDAMYLVWMAIIEFERNKKTKFSTFLWNKCFYHCTNLIKGNKVEQKYNKILQKEWQLINRNFSIKNVFKYDIETLLSYIKSERIRKVFEIKFVDNGGKISFDEIGRTINCSRTTVFKDFKEGLRQIKRKINQDIV